ncbi:hypothetical protein PR048_023265 [Dryococelus australis]|uniref:Uncharacterized protein n=1 Tax=Dryococelus australis TaxID=614101 RepID=A0ABQ9GTN1_9NEOP|nr:hypothetical protein PR048_023265 [Dryococelus australis]
MKGWGKWDIPEETHRPTSSSGTILTCKNLVTRPGNEPGSPWWESSRLTVQPPWPRHCAQSKRCRGGLVVRVLASNSGEQGSIPGGRCSWLAGFFEDMPFLPPLHSGAAAYSLHITLIDSQSRPR